MCNWKSRDKCETMHDLHDLLAKRYKITVPGDDASTTTSAFYSEARSSRLPTATSHHRSSRLPTSYNTSMITRSKYKRAWRMHTCCATLSEPNTTDTVMKSSELDEAFIHFRWIQLAKAKERRQTPVRIPLFKQTFAQRSSLHGIIDEAQIDEICLFGHPN